MLIIANYYISSFQLLNKVWICPLLNHFNSVTYKAHNFSSYVCSYGSLWFLVVPFSIDLDLKNIYGTLICQSCQSDDLAGQTVLSVRKSYQSDAADSAVSGSATGGKSTILVATD